MVCAELGKNFPEAPSPSRSMEAGAIGGLTMRLARASRQPTSRVHHKHAENAKNDVGVQPIPETKGRADFDQRDAEQSSGSKKHPAQAGELGCAAKQGDEKNQKQQKSEGSGGNVKEIDNRVGDRGGRTSIQIRGAQSEQNQKTI